MRKLILALFCCLLCTTAQPQIVDDLKTNLQAATQFVSNHKTVCIVAIGVLIAVYFYKNRKIADVSWADAGTQTNEKKNQIISPQFVQGIPQQGLQTPTDEELDNFQRMLALAQENAQTRDFIGELRDNLKAQTSIPSPTAEERRAYYAKKNHKSEV